MFKIKNYVSLILVILLLVSSGNVFANGYNQSIDSIEFDNYGIKKGANVIFSLMNENNYNNTENLMSTNLIGQWETFPTKSNIPVTKIWTIDFNKSFDFQDIDGIVIEKGGKFIPVKIDLYSTGAQATITPVDSLLNSEVYTIRIFLNNGKKYKMDFKTADAEYAKNIGNTNGNMANGGLVVEHENWIFYSNKGDGGSLWRMNKDGTEKIKLMNGDIKSISVIGDGWVYYAKNGNLYKCRYDGQDETIITSIGSSSSSAVVADDEYIYYYYHGYYNSDKSLNRIRRNGKDYKKLVTNYTSNTPQLSNGWIYYNFDNSSIEKIKTDGTSNTKLLTVRSSNMQVVNNWLYFIDQDNKKIYKIDTDGKNKQQISSDYAEELHVTENGWIYYVNDVDRGMYRIRIDGSQRGKMTDNPVSSINVANGWIYYYDKTENSWFKITQEGKNRTAWND